MIHFGRLKLVQKSETPFDKEEITLSLGWEQNSQTVFRAEKDFYLQTSTVSWRANPNESKLDYFRRLVTFYEAVREGGFTERQYIKNIPQRSSLTYPDSSNACGGKTDSDISLGQFSGEDPEMLRHPHFSDFTALSIGTLFGYFSMEDSDGCYSGRPWDVDNGCFNATSHNDLSPLLTKLILETGRAQVPAQVHDAEFAAVLLESAVRSVLTEKVFKF